MYICRYFVLYTVFEFTVFPLRHHITLLEETIFLFIYLFSYFHPSSECQSIRTNEQHGVFFWSAAPSSARKALCAPGLTVASRGGRRMDCKKDRLNYRLILRTKSFDSIFGTTWSNLFAFSMLASDCFSCAGE